MKSIALKKPVGAGVTLIQNSFIDRYMPGANGEFVKIYLYLLRCLAPDLDGRELSVSSLADTFLQTEKDVVRALTYWEAQGLLFLSRDEEGNVTSIAFEPEKPREEEPQAPDTQKAVPDPQPEAAVPKKKELTADRIRELTGQEEVEQLLFIAAQYIGRPLNPGEISTLLYFYDGLRFSADLIEYLVEYCVTKDKKSLRYMEKVALGWAQEGIRTVQEAKENTSLYNKKYYAVLNAFGIRSRGPAAPERKFIDRWIGEYGFDLPVICEACSRTIAQAHEPSFPYAEGILKSWKNSGVHQLTDVAARDEARDKKKKAEAAAKREAAKRGEASGNKFNNFHQRDYNDFDQLEKDLLNT